MNNKNSISIRRATVTDASLLTKMNEPTQEAHAEAHPTFFKGNEVDRKSREEAFISLLKQEKSPVWIAWADETAVGYLCAVIIERPENPWSYAQKSLQIDQISVNETEQRNGIGAKLIATAVAFAKTEKITILNLTVWAFNNKGQAFFKKQGFNPKYHQFQRTVD